MVTTLPRARWPSSMGKGAKTQRAFGQCRRQGGQVGHAPVEHRRRMKMGCVQGMLDAGGQSGRGRGPTGAVSPPPSLTWVAPGTADCCSRLGKHAQENL